MDVYGDFVHFSPRRFCQIDLIPLWCCSAFLGFLSSTKARKKLQRRHVANEHRAEAEVARRENEVRFKRRFQVPSADFLDLQNSIPLRRILHLPKLHVAIVFEDMKFVSFYLVICLERLSARRLSKAGWFPIVQELQVSLDRLRPEGFGPQGDCGIRGFWR